MAQGIGRRRGPVPRPGGRSARSRITTEGRTVLWRGHKSDLEREAQQLSLPGITIEPVEEEPEEPTK